MYISKLYDGLAADDVLDIMDTVTLISKDVLDFSTPCHKSFQLGAWCQMVYTSFRFEKMTYEQKHRIWNFILDYNTNVFYEHQYKIDKLLLDLKDLQYRFEQIKKGL